MLVFEIMFILWRHSFGTCLFCKHVYFRNSVYYREFTVSGETENNSENLYHNSSHLNSKKLKPIPKIFTQTILNLKENGLRLFFCLQEIEAEQDQAKAELADQAYGAAKAIDKIDSEALDTVDTNSEVILQKKFLQSFTTVDDTSMNPNYSIRM